MVVTIASMKGGVGKTTIATMFAKFVAEQRGTPVTVVDMDPQRGATTLLLGCEHVRKATGPGTYEILGSEQDNIPSTELFYQAVQQSPYDARIRVVPSDASLARLGPDTPRDLLRLALEVAPLQEDETVIVDTGPEVTLCEMSIAAADLVFVPITMSHQTGLPTLNTLQAVLLEGRGIGGLIPTMIGSAMWHEKRVDSWREALMNTVTLKRRGIDLLPSMPFSHAIPSGKWRWGKLPRRCLPALDAMYARVFGERTLNETGLDMDEREVEVEAGYPGGATSS
jgi:cellulose biosynthesis protein BcsQ